MSDSLVQFFWENSPRPLFSSSLVFLSLWSKDEEENTGRAMSLGSKEEEENTGKGLIIVWFNFFEKITL